MAGVSKLYTKKVNGVAVDRGIAFPVCISVNDIVCHHSPLKDEEKVSFNWMQQENIFCCLFDGWYQ